MAEIMKERGELDPQFQWDLTPMYENDAAWETELASLDADIESLSAFAGKLTDAVTIGAYLDMSTEVGRKVERLYCYEMCIRDRSRTTPATSCWSSLIIGWTRTPSTLLKNAKSGTPRMRRPCMSRLVCSTSRPAR